MEADPLVTALRNLRRGRGLTLARLKATPSLLEMLGTSDVEAAMETLLDAIRQLGADVQAESLRNAYALGMATSQTLTTRRNTFAVLQGRDPDTIESYENAMIDELAARLTTRADPEQRVLTIAAFFRNKTLFSVYTRIDPSLKAAGYALLQSDIQLSFVNESGTGPSPPALIYEYANPASTRKLQFINLAVSFEGGAVATEAWAVHSVDILDLIVGSPRSRLDIDQGRVMAVFSAVPPVRYYGLFWLY